MESAKAWALAQYEAHPWATGFVVGIAVLLLVSRLLKSTERDLHTAPSITGINAHASNVAAQADFYTRVHATGGGSVEDRKSNYADMVNAYYSLATDFYEFGWGQSFHFAPRNADESFEESIKRHEYWLSSRLGLHEGQRVLDVGCGVGGPARNIARFSGAHVTGLNNNDYQVSRATAKTAAMGLSAQVDFTKGDFMRPPFPDAAFDAAYAIEATCHAPDRTGCFSEIHRMLKPGGVFGGYEWVTTDAYDAANPEHREIKHGIEVGDGLPDITDGQAVLDALTGAGFVVEEFHDLAPTAQISWYDRFNPSYTLSGFKTTPVGIALTSAAVWVLESLWLAPKGTFTMHRHLVTGAKTLTAGGRLGIFTPMYYFRARKPADKAPAAAKAATTPAASKRGRSPSAGAAKRR